LNDERVLEHRTDARLCFGEKPRYRDLTYFGEEQVGNFILTDRRILFLRKSSMATTLGQAALEFTGLAGFLAGIPAGIVVGDMVGDRLVSARIKPEEVESVLKENPESIAIPLENVVDAEARRAYMATAYLVLKYNAPEGIKACSFLFGTAAKGQRELAKAIMSAKRNLTPQPSTTTPEATKFCINCGQRIANQARFCSHCGGTQ
jgi:hypothetical protein